ncbi:MAG: lysine biosynthesis protein LysW [Anaerolineales bacterium]|nr:lysine biosynthesis protein LysW [Anaerolineales bacterium]
MCPECGAALAQAAQLHEGEQVMCKHCDARLEVIRLLPLELDWVYAEAYQAPE